MKEQLLKLINAGVFALAGLFGYNELADAELISVWSVFLSGAAGVAGYYVGRLLNLSPAPNQ